MSSFLRSNCTALIITFIAVIIGCSKSNKVSDTYLQFSVEGTEYKLDHVILDMVELDSDNWHLMMLGQDPLKINIVTAVPSAGIQWRMVLANIEGLRGREIDLSDINDDRLEPIATFTLTQDIGVTPDISSELKLKFVTVNDTHVEGTFTGKNLSYVSMSEDILRKVSVSGSFRAKINVINR